MEAERKKGALLLVDSGNALFKFPGASDAAARARAELILETMGKLGTLAMAAGERDLNLGADFLKARAEQAHLKVLSANLTADGKPPFPASTVSKVGGVKVGLIGATRPGRFTSPGLEAGPVVPAVLAEVKRLRPSVELVVVLAAVPYADALQLLEETKGGVDLILHSHEARGPGPAQRGEWSYLLPSGERGRQLGRLELDLSGKGPFVDLAERERERQAVAALSMQVAQVQKRIERATDPAVRRELESSLANLEASKKAHEKAAGPAEKSARTLRLDWVTLGPELKDDPSIRAKVEQIEPPGPAAPN